ncbi:MAG: hypothetical protein LIO58_01880 [Oscillospiraceae bacterium]|nr:hypothetical protein [Oscillospiraceae bacterium]
MYNRYIPNGSGFTRITEDEDPPSGAPEDPNRTAHSPEEPAQEKKGLLGGLLKGLKLEKLDTGDILLLLIILFIFLDGDDTELLIALGLFLVMGLE